MALSCAPLLICTRQRSPFPRNNSNAESDAEDDIDGQAGKISQIDKFREAARKLGRNDS
jgi:hypothetical protein